MLREAVSKGYKNELSDNWARKTNALRKIVRPSYDKFQKTSIDQDLRDTGIGFRSTHYNSMQNIRQESTDVSLMNQSVDYRFESRKLSYSKEKLPIVLYSTTDADKIPGPGDYNVTVGDIQDKMKKGFGVTYGSDVITCQCGGTTFLC